MATDRAAPNQAPFGTFQRSSACSSIVLPKRPRNCLKQLVCERRFGGLLLVIKRRPKRPGRQAGTSVNCGQKARCNSRVWQRVACPACFRSVVPQCFGCRQAIRAVRRGFAAKRRVSRRRRATAQLHAKHIAAEPGHEDNGAHDLVERMHDLLWCPEMQLGVCGGVGLA
eukprot:15444888-Alexandrium_andersonii.AAC.1